MQSWMVHILFRFPGFVSFFTRDLLCFGRFNVVGENPTPCDFLYLTLHFSISSSFLAFTFERNSLASCKCSTAAFLLETTAFFRTSGKIKSDRNHRCKNIYIHSLKHIANCKRNIQASSAMNPQLTLPTPSVYQWPQCSPLYTKVALVYPNLF